MTITSKFYTGAVNNIEWAQGLRAATHRYSVADDAGTGAGFKVAINGAVVRGFSVAAGTAGGGGITDVNDATLIGATYALPFNAADRWWLIGLRRVWGSTKATTLDWIAGTGTEAIPSRPVTPGIEDFQPLALAFVPAGGGAITLLRDLRAICGTSGVLVGAHDLVKDYMNAVGTRLWINGTEWTRTLDGTAGAAKWVSSKIGCKVSRSTNLTIPNGGTSETVVGFTTELYDYDEMHDTVTNNDRVTINTAGVYLITFNGELNGALSPGTDYGQIRCAILRNGTIIAREQKNPIDTGSSNLPQRMNVSTTAELSVGDYLQVGIFQTNDSTAGRALLPNDYSPLFSVARIG